MCLPRPDSLLNSGFLCPTASSTLHLLDTQRHLNLNMSKTKKCSLTFLYSAPASSFHLSNGPTTYSEVQTSNLEFILETQHPHPTSSPLCNPTSRYLSNTCRNPRSHQCMDYCHSFPSDSVSIFIHYNRSPPKARVTFLKM